MEPYVNSCLKVLRELVWNSCLLRLAFPWYIHHAHSSPHPPGDCTQENNRRGSLYLLKVHHVG